MDLRPSFIFMVYTSGLAIKRRGPGQTQRVPIPTAPIRDSGFLAFIGAIVESMQENDALLLTIGSKDLCIASERQREKGMYR